MEQNKNAFSLPAAALSILTAAVADAALPAGSVRAALLAGLLDATLLSALVWLIGAWQNFHPAWVLACAAGLLAELLRTLLQAQAVCRQEFHSMALIGVLPLLLLAGWQVTPGQWNTAARVLWWLAAAGAAICLLGLADQMRWTRLIQADAGLPAVGTGSMLYAEYLVWPLLCPARKPGRAVCLPWLAFAVQAAVLLGMRLIFGAGEYPAAELLRAWSSGPFSRVDAVLFLIWLGCAFYRVGFLCAALRLCRDRLFRERKEVQT